MKPVTLFRMKKGFFMFAWTFMFLYSCIAIPSLLITKEYAELILVFVILTFLIIMTVWLYKGIAFAAKDFAFSKTEVSFVYADHVEHIKCCDLSKIIITPNRYIFCGKKRYYVTRITGLFKVQKDIDPRIYEIAIYLHIPYLNIF